ncbi:hypothetical protein [Streptomyces canarius]
MQRLAKELEDSVAAGSVSPTELKGLAERLDKAATELDAALQGHIKDAAELGGTYTLRNQHAPVVAVARHLARLADAALQETAQGVGLVLKRFRGTQTSVHDVRGLSGLIRRYRTDKAFAEVPTGEQWRTVLPGEDERMRQLFPDLATMSKSDQVTFVRTLSERNIEALREEVGALLTEMPEAERARFGELWKALEELPYRIKHATPAYHAIANSGVMSSQGDLSRRGLRFLASGKSSAKNTTNLGNDDFVFFRMEVGDRPMATRYGPTTLVFDAKVLEEQGGWVSLHDQLHPLDRDTMSQLKMGGDVVRSATYDDGFTEMGRRSRWTYTYPDKSTRQVSFEQEVFHGEHVREALALSVVREVHLIGGAFQEDVFRLLADAAQPEELGAVVSKLYRPEAKFGSGLPINPYGSRVETEWPRPITVHDADGDGRYLADGTVDPTARAAGKAFDEASDRVRQADNAVKSGNNKALRYNLNKALPHAEQSVKLTAEFQATAVGERKELANALLDQRARLLKDIEARLRELRSRPKPDPARPQWKPDENQGTGAPAAGSGAGGPNLNELPRRAEDALNTVRDVTEQMRKVIRALGNSDGFRPLLDAKVSAQTNVAVGLGRTQFSTAYRHLSRAGLVIGDPAGLHLTEEGRRLFLLPRADTGTTASSQPPAAGVATAPVGGQGRGSRHAGGADDGPREGPGAPDGQTPAPDTAPGPADPARPLPDPGTASRPYELRVSGQRLYAVPVGERPGDTAFRFALDTETAPPPASGRVLAGDGLVLGGDEWVVRLGEARTAVGLLSPSDRRSLWRETAAVMREHYPAPELIRDSGDDYAGWFDAVAHVVALALLDDTARPVGADHPARRLARNLLPQLSRLLNTPLVPSARPLLLGGSRVPAGQQERRELDRTLSGRPSAPSGSGPADSPGPPTGGEGSRGNRLRRINNRLDLRSGAAPGSGDRDATASSAPRHGLSTEPRAVGAGEERGRSREPGRSSAAASGTSPRQGGTGAGPSRAASVSAREGERGRQPTRGTAPTGRGGAGAPRAASSAVGGRRSSSVGRAFGSMLNFFVRDRDRRSASGVRAAAPTTPAESPGYWHARGQGRSGSVLPEPFGDIPPATRTSGQVGAASAREASAPVNAGTIGSASAERGTAPVPSRAGGMVEARAGNADPTRHEAEARAREAEAARRVAEARADEAEARAREAEAARRVAEARADEAQARAREAETSHQRGEAARTQREAQARAYEEAEARTRQAEAALRSDEMARAQQEVDARAHREADAARALHEAEARLRTVGAARRRGEGGHARQEAAAWHEVELRGDEAAKATSALRRAENRAQQAVEQARRTEVRHREAEAALRQVQTERERRDARKRDEERITAARARREAQQRLQEARASADDAEAARREAVAVRREAGERAREAEAARRAVEAVRAKEKAKARPRKDETRHSEAPHPVPALPSQRNPQPDVWQPTAVMTPGGKTGGIDVRPAARRLTDPVKQVQTQQQILYGQGQSRAFETPPWVSSENPFFVFVDGSPSELRVAAETGERKMSAEEFARFLKALPAELSPAQGAPIVLVLSRGGAGGLQLPREIAYHTDRTVWSFTSALQLVTDPNRNLTYISRNYPADGSRPAGWWISSRPEDIGPDSAVAAATSSGALGVIEHHTLVNAQGRPIGRIAHTPDDVANRETRLAHIATADTYSQGVREGRHLIPIDGTARELPWRIDHANVTPYFFSAHGNSSQIRLPLPDGTKRRATGSELARFLKRRPSFNQRKDVPIVLMSCRTGSDPSPEGVAQTLANATRRVVYAPTGVSSVSFTVGSDPDGREGRWARFDPAAGGTGASRSSRTRPARPVDEPVPSAHVRVTGGLPPRIDTVDADPTEHEPLRQSPVGGPDRRSGIDEFAERLGGTPAHGVPGGRSATGASRPDPVPSRRRNRGVQGEDPFADDRELRRGWWVLSRPADAAPARSTAAGPDALSRTDGEATATTELVTHTLVGFDHRPIGRLSLPADFLARVEGTVDRASWRDTEGAGGQPFPWAGDVGAGRRPYFWMSHGWPTDVEMVSHDGNHRFPGAALGRYLRRRPSLAGLDAGHPIVLLSCSTGDTRGAGEPGVVVAQKVADATGRAVHAADTPVFVSGALLPGGAWHTFLPHRPEAAWQAQEAVPSPGRADGADGPLLGGPVLGERDWSTRLTAARRSIGALDLDEQGQLWADVAAIMQKPYRTTPYGPQPYPAPKLIRDGSDTYAEHYHDIAHLVAAELLADTAQPSGRDTSRAEDLAGELLSQLHRRREVSPPVTAGPGVLGGSGRAPGARPEDERGRTRHRTARPGGDAGRAESRAGGAEGQPGNSFARTFRAASRAVARSLSRAFGRDQDGSRRPQSRVRPPREINPYADAGPSGSRAGGERRPSVSARPSVSGRPSADGRSATHGPETPGIPGLSFPGRGDDPSGPRRDGTGTRRGMSVERARGQGSGQAFDMTSVRDHLPGVQPEYWSPAAILDADIKMVGIDLRPRSQREREPLTALDTRHEVVYTDVSGGRPVDAQWRTHAGEPFFVAVDGSAAQPTVATSRGERTMTAEEFADQLGRLPVVRNSNGPIVLVLSHGGVGDLLLPRLIARETSRPVWSFVSTLTLLSVNGRTYITRVGSQASSTLHGWWVRSERGDLDTADSRRHGRDIRHERFFFDEVEHYALVDQTGRSVGRIAHREADIFPREHGLLGMSAAESYWHARRQEDGALVTYAQTPQTLPWRKHSSGASPYFFVSHGTSQAIVLPVKGRTDAFVDGATLARFLRRRTSFTRSKDAPVVLMACETGSDTSERGVAQQVANGTGRLVYAPTAPVSVEMVLGPASDGTPGRWNVFRPHDARTVPPAGGPVLPVAGPGPVPGGSGLRPSVSRPGPGGAGGHADRASSRTRQPSRSGRSTGAGTAMAAPGGGAVRNWPGAGSRGPAPGFVPQGARMPDASPHADTATADGPPLDGDGPDSSRHVVTDTLPDGERTSGREHDTLPAKAPSDVTNPSAPPGVPRRDGGYADTAPQAVGVQRAVDATPHGDPHAAGSGAVEDPPSAGDAVRSRPAPAMPEPSRAPGGGSASRPTQPAAFPPRTDAELEAHRPPRLDRSMLPPAESGRAVRFTDGSRLPSYLTGDGAEGRPASYGPGLVTLRGIDQVMREIGARTGLADSPAPGAAGVMADLERALRETPWVFHGEGYESSPFQDRGQPRVLRVVTRPHGNWERFADGYGAPFKYEGVQRGQTTTGTAKSVATSLRIAPGFTIGPPSGLSLAGYGRVGGALGFNRTFDFALQDQTQTQAETRHGDGSHVHLDDVQYEVHLAGPRPAERTSRPADAYSSGEGHFSFGVRNGLAVRLSDGETPSADPGSVADADRVPRSMTLGPHTDYRLVHTEGYGPVREIRDWALRRAGAQPGSSAYDEIAGFFSSANFHRIADRLAHGPVTTRQLASDDRGRTPLGAFVVERVVPGGAELLTGTTAAELRGTVQRAVRNERTLSKAYTQELNATVGPTMSFGRFFAGHAGLRVMAGLSARYARTTTHGTVSGGTGSRKSAGQAKKVPTYLYRVHKTVYVRRAGDTEATAFTTWSLDRMTRTEARRHAGWDDGTTLRRRHDDEPVAPVYLPTDDPVTLGPSRLEAFLHEDGSPLRDQGAGEPARTLLDDLLDQVLHHAARAYPGMLAPLADFGDPSDARWKDAEHYRMALQNTLSVVDTLSHHSLAAGLESLITTGVRVGLVVPGTFGRARRWLWIDGRLTDRRYEGTQNDLLVRSSLPGTERLDGQRNVVRGYDVGVDVSATVLDAHKNRVGAPENTGALQLGPRWAAQTGRRTGFGATVSTESGSAGTSQSHLFSYRLELAVSTGGFWRPRHLWRIASLGLLGTQAFIRRADTLALVGGGTRASVTGRVLLAVPGEHTPAPGLALDAVRRTAPRVRVLAPARAKEIALGTGDAGAAGRARSPFGDLPHTTVSVAAHRELISAAEELMREASGGSWHFAEPGALAHEALVRPFEAPYLSGQSDLSSAPGGRGSRVSSARAPTWTGWARCCTASRCSTPGWSRHRSGWRANTSSAATCRRPERSPPATPSASPSAAPTAMRIRSGRRSRARTERSGAGAGSTRALSPRAGS